MKNLKDIIIEKLNVKNIKIHPYKYHPQTKEELRKILEERLAKDKNADLNDIDVSEITDMSSLFFRLFPHNIDISKWDVSKVENMESMFESSGFNGDISKWDVSNVTNMGSMFYCSKFTGKKGDISKWNVSKVENMEGCKQC